jgi:hypothetical protein
MVACRKGYLFYVVSGNFSSVVSGLSVKGSVVSGNFSSVVSGASVKGFVVSGGTKRSHRCKF